MDNKVRTVRNLNVRCHHSLLGLIRRAFFLSGVCIVTDVTIAFGVKGVYNLFPNAVFALIVMYDVNLVINIICIVTTFRRWRRMLFPWLYDCCGKSTIGPYSKSDFSQQRPSNAGLNGSTVGSIRIKNSPIRESIALGLPKLTTLPLVDVQLVGDDEDSDEREYKKSKQRENGFGDEKSKQSDATKSERKWKNNSSATSRFADFLQFGYSRNDSKIPHPRIRRYTTGSTDQSIDENGATLVSTSEVSFKSKQRNNVVTTKIIVKSGSMILFDKTSWRIDILSMGDIITANIMARTMLFCIYFPDIMYGLDLLLAVIVYRCNLEIDRKHARRCSPCIPGSKSTGVVLNVCRSWAICV